MILIEGNTRPPSTVSVAAGCLSACRDLLRTVYYVACTLFGRNPYSSWLGWNDDVGTIENFFRENASSIFAILTKPMRVTMLPKQTSHTSRHPKARTRNTTHGETEDRRGFDELDHGDGEGTS